jgi:hypothetical protein
VNLVCFMELCNKVCKDSNALRDHLNAKHQRDQIPHMHRAVWVRCGLCGKCGRRTLKGNVHKHTCARLSNHSAASSSASAPDGALFVPVPINRGPVVLDEVVEEDVYTETPLALSLVNGPVTERYLHKSCWGNWVATNKMTWADAAAKTGNQGPEEVSAVLLRFVETCQLALRRPKGKGGRKRINKLKEQMRGIEEGEVVSYPHTAPVLEHEDEKEEEDEEDAPEFARACRAAKAILAGGQYLKGNNKGRISKANAALKRARAPKHNLSSPELMKAMRELRGPAIDGLPLPSLPSNAPHLVNVDPELLEKCLQFLASGSSPGPSGWTAELLLAIWADDTCREAICALVKHIANGNMNEEARRVLLAAIMIAVAKKHGVRPIAMGETLYKLAVRYLLCVNEDVVCEQFKEVQLALGKLGGPEMAIHILRAAMEKGEENCILTLRRPPERVRYALARSCAQFSLF